MILSQYDTCDIIMPNVSSLLLTPMCSQGHVTMLVVMFPVTGITPHWPGCTGDLTRDRFLPITHQRPQAPAASVQTTFHVVTLQRENPYLIGTGTIQLSLFSFANNDKVVTSPPLVSFLMECGPGLAPPAPARPGH